jgi:hypothetical protein
MPRARSAKTVSTVSTGSDPRVIGPPGGPMKNRVYARPLSCTTPASKPSPVHDMLAAAGASDSVPSAVTSVVCPFDASTIT